MKHETEVFIRGKKILHQKTCLCRPKAIPTLSELCQQVVVSTKSLVQHSLLKKLVIYLDIDAEFSILSESLMVVCCYRILNLRTYYFILYLIS
jgi:hypothetical protein